MTIKELLIAQGVTEEQADKIIEAMPANKLYIASEENLDIRYQKATQQLEQAKADLKNATDLVANLKKDNANVADLQTKITEYETKVTQLETERAAERKNWALKEALTKAGANDIDYMVFKLGDVEVEKDGTIKDLDNKVKSLKEAHPSFFAAAADPAAASDPAKNENKGGFKVIDNKLATGQDPAPKQPDSLAEAIKQQYTMKEAN